jgi:hypothetical protein
MKRREFVTLIGGRHASRLVWQDDLMAAHSQSVSS